MFPAMPAPQSEEEIHLSQASLVTAQGPKKILGITIWLEH